MLSGAGFGYDACLAHAARQQYLSDGVVDFVCAGVVEVLALEVDAAAVYGRQAPGQIQGRGAPHVVAQQLVELPLKFGGVNHLAVGLLQLADAAVQDFGDVGTAKVAIESLFVNLKS